MHFALPPRKSSNPSPYAARSYPRFQIPRRNRLQFIALCALAAISTLYILRWMFSGGAERIPSGTAPVVIVTVFDSSWPVAFSERIKQNRLSYAKKQGYTTFFANTTAYPLTQQDPRSWAKVPSVRHAMTLNPHSTWFWYLSPTALIMDQSLSLEGHITNPERIESLMITDQPVVPPDSVIKTFTGLSAEKVNLILTQDKDGLSQESFIVRRGEWAKYFLDAWFDPLYRSYNFQKAEGHALEHIVQWHGTILSNLALIPQRIMNSYVYDTTGNTGGLWLEGDFVANFAGCDDVKQKRNCKDEMVPFFVKLQNKYL